MKSEGLSLVASIAVLAVTGALADRVATPVWQVMRQKEPAFRVDHVSAAPGMTAAFAWLGGWRALVADGLWLRLHTKWEARDDKAAAALVRAVSAVDPRPIYFWQNGARIMAYDFAAWRIEAAGGYDVVSRDEQQRIVREQARAALEHLAAAERFHRASAALWVERANIEYGRLQDFAAAAESYRRAAEQKDAPSYAARLHAEMLRRLGRRAEALAWLVKLHPTLPPDDEIAAADLVLSRIRELERELGVRPESAYGAGGR